MKSDEALDIFFREKPAIMLISLKNANGSTYASSLSKKVDCTYSHVVKILQKMEDLGLIDFEKYGRLKLLKLTKKGKEFASHIEMARNVLIN